MSVTTGIAVITCPQCSRSLPPAAAKCHFCGADLANVARPKAATKKKAGPESWVLALYYIVACYWVASGAYAIYSSLVEFQRASAEAEFGPGFFPIISIVIGSIGIILGLGLLVKWELARGIVNVFSWLRIASSALGLYGLFMLAPLLPAAVLIVGIVFSVLDIVMAGLQIWLISETDNYGW